MREKPLSLVEISDISDPDERLRQHLRHLDEAIHNAKNRKRIVNHKRMTDPDAAAVTKCLELANRLTNEAAKRRGTDTAGSLAAGYERQIAELRGALQAYGEMPLEDWLALRQRYLR